MEKKTLNENELQGVVGGAKKISIDDKRKEFEKAWNTLKMDNKGFSGMKRAELFDEWEMNDFASDASSFLAEYSV